MIAPAWRLAVMPEGLSALEAAPLMCSGPTTFNAIQEQRGAAGRPASPSSTLADLGHLGVQYAAKMGFRTAAIARGKDKEPLARQLGATPYIDSQSTDPAAEPRNWEVPRRSLPRSPTARPWPPPSAASPPAAA